MSDMKYPIAPNGIFRTVQGEGALLGVPMVFVRLAGCSIGCPQCDTDYRVHERLTAQEIGERVVESGHKEDWVWVTGGEPADHNLTELLKELRKFAQTALATSGTKELSGADSHLDFISISPHGTPSDLKLLPGRIHRFAQTQLNLVPGLNGLRLSDWDAFAVGFAAAYSGRWVTPMNNGPATCECMAFVENHPGWRLGIQAHKTWGLA
jgi:7-carboxy-7-deazaguanine synthase